MSTRKEDRERSPESGAARTGDAWIDIRKNWSTEKRAAFEALRQSYAEKGKRLIAVVKGELSPEESGLSEEELNRAAELASIPERMRLAREHVASLYFDEPQTVDDWAEIARILRIDPIPLTLGEIYEQIIEISQAVQQQVALKVKRDNWISRVYQAAAKREGCETAESQSPRTADGEDDGGKDQPIARQVRSSQSGSRRNKRPRGRKPEVTETDEKILEIHHPGQKHADTASIAGVYTPDGELDIDRVRRVLKADSERQRRKKRSTK
ncbi:MAG: hypothetical protein O2945_23495 [Planctomycetota bacterium]|nr:hypothetical protein [Planctomycetota bacterium]